MSYFLIKSSFENGFNGEYVIGKEKQTMFETNFTIYYLAICVNRALKSALQEANKCPSFSSTLGLKASLVTVAR